MRSMGLLVAGALKRTSVSIEPMVCKQPSCVTLLFSTGIPTLDVVSLTVNIRIKCSLVSDSRNKQISSTFIQSAFLSVSSDFGSHSSMSACQN